LIRHLASSTLTLAVLLKGFQRLGHLQRLQDMPFAIVTRVRSEGVRRHAKASRHAEAFDPRKLTQVGALAANDRDLRLVNLLETQHVAAHPLPPLCVFYRMSQPLTGLPSAMLLKEWITSASAA